MPKKTALKASDKAEAKSDNHELRDGEGGGPADLLAGAAANADVGHQPPPGALGLARLLPAVPGGGYKLRHKNLNLVLSVTSSGTFKRRDPGRDLHVLKVVLQKSTPLQICQLIFYYY